MAGHSKWANIQHRKKAQDAKRGKLFTKLIREITIAAKMGGGDITANPRLRLAVDKGLSNNMTRDTIERAIKRGAGGLDGADVEELVYEGYGPGGIAVLVECITDNRKRTVADVRHAFTKAGGNLGTDGSVAYLFTKRGILTFAPDQNEEAIMDVAIESGADDVVVNDDGSIDVLTTPDIFTDVRTALTDTNLVPDNADVVLQAATDIELDIETAGKFLKMIEMLDELDDVQNVYHNANVPEAVFGSD